MPPSLFALGARGLAVLLTALLAACGANGGSATGEGAGPAGASGGERAEQREVHEGPLTLSVVATNDVHGHAHRLAMIGGFVENLRAARREDGGVLLVDAGDMWQGTLVSNLGEGEAMVRAYEALGYDAAAIGNHEFDYGPVGEATVPEEAEDDPRGALLARVAEAGFPILSANILDAESGERVRWPGVEPSVVREVAGVRVGIVGVSTEETLRTTLSGNVSDLRMAPVAVTVATEARRLRERGAEIVVVLAHLGGECERFDDPADHSSCESDAEVFELARALPEGLVDLIAAGHTHAGVAHRVDGIPIIESFGAGRAFGRVDLLLDRESHELREARIHPPRPICGELSTPVTRCRPGEYEGRPVTRHEGVHAAVAPDLERAREAQARELGVELRSEARRSYDSESALGNLLADLMRGARPQTDIALINGGGIRAGLPAGPLTYGALYEAFPFDNRFAVVKLSAAELATVLASNLRHDGGFLSISGARAVARCEQGQLGVELRTGAGEPIPADARLEVLASDFLVTGGDEALTRAIEEGAESTIEDGRPLRDELAAHLAERGGELRPGEHYDTDDPRVDYPGERPVRCD